MTSQGPPSPSGKSEVVPPALTVSPSKISTPASVGGGTVFSRFIGKMELKSPAFEFARVGPKQHSGGRRSIVSMAGQHLIEVEGTAASPPLLKAWGIHQSGSIIRNKNRGKKGQEKLLGMTESGERVYEMEDEIGLSAKVQWTVDKPKSYCISPSRTPENDQVRFKSGKLQQHSNAERKKDLLDLSAIDECRDAWSSRECQNRLTAEEESEAGISNDNDDEEWEEEEEEEAAAGEQKAKMEKHKVVFPWQTESESARGSHKESQTFKLSFGSGTVGLIMVSTKAGKGAFLESFKRLETRQGRLPTAAELCGQLRVGDVITQINTTDVRFSSATTVQELLDNGERPITVIFRRYPQSYSFQEVAQDSRKVPFYFQYLLTEVTDPRHEQAKVMLLIESEQYASQYKNMTAVDRALEGQRIFDKFFDTRSHFDLSADIPSQVLKKLRAQCYPPPLATRSVPVNPLLRPPRSSGPITLPEVGQDEDECTLRACSCDMFNDVRHLIQEDLDRGSFPRFRESLVHHRMVGYLSQSPEYVPLHPLEVLQNDDMLQFFMLYLMQARKHASLRCYLDMERFVKPRVAAVEDLLRRGLVASEKAKQAVKTLMQAVLRVFSLYLCNGSYMEVTLRPLSRLNQWLRSVLNSRADIARIQRRACKLAASKAAETEILGSQLLKEAHRRRPGALFTLSVPDALGIGHEVLGAQRSLLRELASDIFPRFQSHTLYEALCEDISPDWRLARAQQQPLTMKPGSIKRLLRRVKLPGEFAVHRAPLFSTPSGRSGGASSPLQSPPITSPPHGLLSPLSSPLVNEQWQQQQAPAARPEVESAADWLMVFDTEFSPNMAIKVRTTKQIPISTYAKSLAHKSSASGNISALRPGAPSALPAGLETFLVPEEFPTKLGTVPPDPVLFNFLVPGKNDKPFYGACLIMYRPANEALPVDEDDLDLNLSPVKQNISSPLINVDLTISQSLGGKEKEAQVPSTAPQASGMTLPNGVPTHESDAPLAFPHVTTSEDSSISSSEQSTALSSLDPVQNSDPENSRRGSQADPPRARRGTFVAYRIERGDEAQEQVKAMADSIFSSPRHDEHGVEPIDGREGDRDDDASEVSAHVVVPNGPVKEQAEGEVAREAFYRPDAPEKSSPSSQSTSHLPAPECTGHRLLSMDVHIPEERTAEAQPLWGPGEGSSSEPEPQMTHDNEDGVQAQTLQEADVDDDDDSLIALVEADFQDALLQSYETFARASSVDQESLPTIVDSPQQWNEGDPAALGGQPPSHHQTYMSALATNSTRRTSAMDDIGSHVPGGQRLRRGSTNASIGTRDGLMAATAKALPVTLTYAPYGFCLMSRFSFINSLRTPLTALFDPKQTRNRSALRVIQTLLADHPPVRVPLDAADRDESLFLPFSTPLPSSPHELASGLSPSGLLSPALTQPGSASASTNCHGPTSATAHQHQLSTQIDFEIDLLFQCLSSRNLILVFLALLLECKVLLISERLTLLTVAGEGLRLLLHPLKWCHVYVPLVPEVMIDHVIGCPTPFLMGLHRKTFLLRRNDFPTDIMRVDLDNDYVEVPAKDLNRKNVPFAGPLARKFERMVSPAMAYCDSYRWPATTPLHAKTTTGMLTTTNFSTTGMVSPPASAGNENMSALPSHSPQKRDVRAALHVLREFVQGLLMGIEDSCYRLCTETEMTILFDETLFGHINGPAELLLITPNDPETDALPHSPHLPVAPAQTGAATESFILRFSRTQAFSNVLMKSLQRTV